MFTVRTIVTVSCLVIGASQARAINGEPIICQCRGPQGQMLELGDRICLKMADGTNRQAVCVMEQNNTSWRVTNELCATSFRNMTPAPQPLASLRQRFKNL